MPYAVAPSAMELIDQVVVGAGGAAIVTFDSIPQGYSGLVLEYVVRGEASADTVNLELQFNDDGGGNYDYEAIVGATTSVVAVEGLGQTSGFIANISGDTADAENSGTGSVNIPSYVQGALDHFVNTKYGAMAGATEATVGGIFTGISSIHWRTSNAVTKIELFANSGDIAVNSVFNLYGIRGE